MEITESQLSAEYQRSSSKWLFIQPTELAHGLPKMLLYAVGSRETNLTNEVGDGGHGHGVWQLDDRSHTPPGGWQHFDSNVPLQCATAAAMLHSLLTNTGGNVEEAAASYNSGQAGRPGTTHHDYGIDVLERMQTLQRLFGGSQPQNGNVPSWFHRDLALASPFMKGDDVSVVQKKIGVTADGLFGPVTQLHVISFQSHHGLTADGIVGPVTARALGS